MQENIETHPLYHYADFALNKISQRFPQGAGNRLDQPTPIIPLNIFENMIKFIQFSSAPHPNAQEYAQLITGLKDATADIMVSYSVGSLRMQYPDKKTLFSCLYINQDIPQNTSKSYQQTHVLLAIGAKSSESENVETVLLNNPNALICDLWAQRVYKMADFYRIRMAEPTITMCFLLYNLTLKFPIGLFLCGMRPLHGQLRRLSCDNAEPFFQILEDFVSQDTHLEAAHRTNLRTQSLFSETFLGRRETWERAHKQIVGYITDPQGHTHTIRRLSNTHHYAYWDHHTHSPTRLKFRKDSESGEYHSDLGVLSKAMPHKDIPVIETKNEVSTYNNLKG